MPGEADYGAEEFRHRNATLEEIEAGTTYSGHDVHEEREEHGGTATMTKVATRRRTTLNGGGHGGHSNGRGGESHREETHTYGSPGDPAIILNPHAGGVFTKKTLHEIFLNPGLFLLFGGIFIGFVGQLQGNKIVAEDNHLFIDLFHGALCLFLLEMGITACRRLRDLKTVGGAGSQPNVAAGFDVQLQCHHRNSDLHRNCQGYYELACRRAGRHSNAGPVRAALSATARLL